MGYRYYQNLNSYIIGVAEFMVSVCEVAFVAHLAIVMLLEMPAALSFILKV